MAFYDDWYYRTHACTFKRKSILLTIIKKTFYLETVVLKRTEVFSFPSTVLSI